jgi:acetoin utilization protein AcuC
VDGHRATYLALRALADELCGGKWVATGGGGYALVEAVPRSWTHLLAIATGDALDPRLPTPTAWRDLARSKLDGTRPRLRLLPGGPGIPMTMGDDVDPTYTAWQPGDGGDAVDRAIVATRREVFPLLGLDPYDPRD